MQLLHQSCHEGYTCAADWAELIILPCPPDKYRILLWEITVKGLRQRGKGRSPRGAPLACAVQGNALSRRPAYFRCLEQLALQAMLTGAGSGVARDESSRQGSPGNGGARGHSGTR